MSRLDKLIQGIDTSGAELIELTYFSAILGTCNWLPNGNLCLDSRAFQLIEELNQCLD